MTIAIGESGTEKEYWEKRLSERWGLHGVGHISFGLPYNQWLYRLRRRIFLRQLDCLALNPGDVDVLDVGLD